MQAPLERYRPWIVVGVAAVLAAAIVFLVIERRGGPPPLEIRLDELAGGPIEVYIAGAVARPGVYEMQPGDRVVDLLQAAGGFTPDADPEAIGLAKRLQDEETVVVPRRGGAASAVAGATTAAIDINSASADKLDDLPGIGAVYSQRIVDSRATDGPFATTEELVARDLIPRLTYETIRELIVAGP